jgi:hypothetical protein
MVGLIGPIGSQIIWCTFYFFVFEMMHIVAILESGDNEELSLRKKLIR